MAIKWWTEQVQFADGSKYTPFYDLSVSAQRVWDLYGSYIATTAYSGVAKNTYFDLGYLMRNLGQNVVNTTYTKLFKNSNIGISHTPMIVESARMNARFGLPNVIFQDSVYCKYSNINFTAIIGFVVDDVNHLAKPIIYREGTNGGVLNSFNINNFGAGGERYANLYNALVGAIPLVGDYYPVANFYSTNGNTPLSMIKHENTNNGNYVYTTGDAFFQRRTEQTNLKYILNNMSPGDKQLLFYCGDNRCYIECVDVKKDVGSPNNDRYEFYLSYSFGGAPVDSQLTRHYIISSNSATGHVDFWFTMLVDQQHSIATPSVVTYNSSGYYDYNTESTTSSYEPTPNPYSETALRQFYRWLSSYGDEETKPNPFDDNPKNDEASGGVNFKPKKDEPNLPGNLPIVDGANINFFRVYAPSSADLRSFASFLWSDSFIDNIKKLFSNPIDVIIGLHILPFTPEHTTTATNVICGDIDSGVPMYQITNRYQRLHLGEMEIKPSWDGYLDFSPFTKVEIYLPFCGTYQLNTDDVMQSASNTSEDPYLKPTTGATLKVDYVIDTFTGACVAQVMVNDSIHYQFSGNCASQLPISSSSHANIVNSLIGVAATAAATIATDGAAAPFLAQSILNTTGNLKPNINKVSNLNSALGHISYLAPYITISQPIATFSSDEEKFKGFTSYMTRTFSDCRGFTKVFDVHLEGFSCTQEERDELENILKEGVIV